MIHTYFLNKITIIALLTLVVLGAFFASQAKAFSTVELKGYAWSPNIGWISMNCSNTNECGTSNYKVLINPDKTLTGYAWSSNIGWIQFGGLSGFPASGGNAKVVGSYDTSWNFAGWARALANGDGWDGWISLSGTATDGSPYKMDFSKNGVLTGSSYAWGADVVGWINFSQSYFTAPNIAGNICTNNYTGTVYVDMWGVTQPSSATACVSPDICINNNPVCATLTIGGSLTVVPKIVRKNDTADTSWSINNQASVDSCKVTSNDGGTWTALSLPTGTVTSGPLTLNTNIFTLSCIPAGGGPDVEVASTTVRLLPSIFES